MSENKRIAKNTGFLYVKMVVLMLISLYTSRILLNELGVSDFGIYNVVGGVVAMFASLKGMFASSTQRFLNFEMGKNNVDKLKQIFSMSITIHILICIVFFLLAEAIGTWFINNELNINQERINAAHWVFQFSVFAALVKIITIPYDAVIIANERMDIFAYISILEGVLKLIIVFYLIWYGGDKLILYSILVFLSSMLIRVVTTIYCKKNFVESRYQFFWDSKLFRNMGGFAGWNFLGNTAFTIANEGLNILLNIFGGPAVNAARGIAYQVKSAMTKLISNIMTAVNPQIVKNYASGNYREFMNLLFLSSRLSYSILLAVILPVFHYTEFILSIWLVDVPEYATIFVQYILIYLLFRNFHSLFDSLFKADGRVKVYQILESVILLLSLPISYLVLLYGYHYSTIFIVMIGIEILNIIALLFLAGSQYNLSYDEYFSHVVKPCLSLSVISYLISFAIKSFSPIHMAWNIFSLILIVVIVLLLSWFITVDKVHRLRIKNIIRKHLNY